MHHASFLTITSFLLSICFAGTALQAQQYYYKNNNTNSVRVEVGDAIYYADYLHGRTTALGEVYRMEQMTCAHRTYPKGTLLKITRMDNGSSVVCRVNDRGPYGKGDVVDISKAAAMKIGLLRDGRTRVSVEPVGTSGTNPNGEVTAEQTPAQYNQTQQRNTVYYPTPERYAAKEQLTAKSGYYTPQQSTSPSSYDNVASSRINTNSTNNNTSSTASGSVDILAPGVTGYAIQLASFGNIDNAKRQVSEVKQKGINDVYLMQKDGLNKVVIAVFDNKFAAQQYLDRLRQQYLIDGIVVMLR